MFEADQVYTCHTCKRTWQSGFFHNTECPHCTGTFKRIARFLWRLFVAALTLGMFMFIMGIVKPWFPVRAFNAARVAIDHREFYAYGDVPYLAAVSSGSAQDYYTLRQETPFYVAPVDLKGSGSAAPAATLAAKQVIRMGAPFRNGKDLWAPAEYYEDETLVRGFIPLPRAWKSSVSDYDIDATRDRARDQFASFIKSNFDVSTNEHGTEAERAQKCAENNEYVLEDISGRFKTIGARKEDKPRIDLARDWYRSPRSIDLVVLQHDRGYKRPPLDLNNLNKKTDK